MTAAQAPVAFRLILAIELNLVRAPTVEAIPIPRTLIATIISARANAPAFLRVLRLWEFRACAWTATGLAPKMINTKSCIFRRVFSNIGGDDDKFELQRQEKCYAKSR